LLNSDNLTLITDIIKTFDIYGKELLKESKKSSKKLSPKRNTEEEYKRRQPLKVINLSDVFITQFHIGWISYVAIAYERSAINTD